MNQFAKLFNTHRGQVLVLLRDDGTAENGPCVEISAKPEGFGICATTIDFPDTDKGSEGAQKTFDVMNEERALAALEPLFDLTDKVRAETDAEADHE